MSAEGREQFVAFLADGDVGRYARELPERLRNDFAGAMQLLRNESFQDLLVNYHRAPRTFIVAPEAEDDVTSEWLIRDGAGQEHKPGDYLAEFARYVQENPDHIDAVRILLYRPADWSHEALSELRTKLAANRLRFTTDNLERAHRAQYQKSLIDIISMVKRAVREAEPLFTAEERVDAALAKLSKGVSFSDDQLRWLARFREHLIVNLAVDQSDFDDLPVFSREGGWGVANRAFDGQLADLIRNINAALAA